jgi:hypothetical protein
MMAARVTTSRQFRAVFNDESTEQCDNRHRSQRARGRAPRQRATRAVVVLQTASPQYAPSWNSARRELRPEQIFQRTSLLSGLSPVSGKTVVVKCCCCARSSNACASPSGSPAASEEYLDQTNKRGYPLPPFRRVPVPGQAGLEPKSKPDRTADRFLWTPNGFLDVRIADDIIVWTL